MGTVEMRPPELDDPERLVRVLEPHVLDRRRERLLEVAGRRLASVQVVFDAPYDPHNGAAVVRSCEAFGVQHVHVVERQKPFLAAREVARGAWKWVDIHTYRSVADVVARAGASGHVLVGAHPEGDLEPDDLTKIPKLALVLGNERDGIGDDLARACAMRVRVPMRGFVESLNVSVTAAILLSAATRGRPGDLDDATKRRLYATGLFYSVAKAREILAASG
jgi:tRNA (guanosine-2'-O-)-methyltransferase